MKWKNRIAGVLAVMLLNACSAAFAQTNAVVRIPDAVKIIEEEAFSGCMSISRVEVPEGTAEIRAKAFAGSSLSEICLPDSVEAIADDAFEGCTDFVIEAEAGSYAYEWALNKGYSVREPGENQAPPQGEDELPWLPA
ncbi:MAG: leucine-rich repeat domain-containing protein [Clostridia bacterium]|nr:leucine-rich repeat domain-containing protein [Clostridia bacterium]